MAGAALGEVFQRICMLLRSSSVALTHNFQEPEFVVYGPYCVNYEHAVDVLVREEQHLMVRYSAI